MAKNGSFAEWMNKKVEEENREEVGEEDDEEVPFLTQIYDIQSNFTSQMQELAGGLPESGPLSAAFRNRLRHSMYLFFGITIICNLSHIYWNSNNCCSTFKIFIMFDSLPLFLLWHQS